MDVSQRIAKGKTIGGGFVAIMTILPGLHWLYTLLYGKEGGFQGFIWAGTVTLVVFALAGFFMYCTRAQLDMQDEIDRISKQKEILEGIVLKKRLSSKKGVK